MTSLYMIFFVLGFVLAGAISWWTERLNRAKIRELQALTVGHRAYIEALEKELQRQTRVGVN